MKDAALTVIITFATIILLGTGCLLLPGAVASGPGLSFHDALFTATSAVTVTGLIVEDTGTHFSFFGQLIILMLIQFGGLGFMTFSTLIILLLGKSLSLKDKMILENDFTSGQYASIRSLVKKIFLITFLMELAGAILFYLQFSDLSGPDRLFSSVFHSVSGFCNAGFSLFSTSFEAYRGHLGINLTLMALIIVGGLGFLVLAELYHHLLPGGKDRRLSLHTRLVCITSISLILLGTLVFLAFHPSSPESSSLPQRLLSALFQSVTTRTAGFNTLNQVTLPPPLILMTLFLMFAGASPGSTGGGIKTSTLGMIFLKVKSRFQHDPKVHLFYRSIPPSTIEKAFVIASISLLIVLVSFFLLTVFDPGLSFQALFFEVVSAFGTVGLSMGITAELSVVSKIIIIFTMFVGRIGPLTLMVAIARTQGGSEIQYPQEDVMIG